MEEYRFVAYKNTMRGQMTSSGVIEADDAFTALELIVEDMYPKTVFSATIHDSHNHVLARYVSSKAATMISAPPGFRDWKKDGLYVNGQKVAKRPEMYFMTN